MSKCTNLRLKETTIRHPNVEICALQMGLEHCMPLNAANRHGTCEKLGNSQTLTDNNTLLLNGTAVPGNW